MTTTTAVARAAIPREPGIDHTVALLREGYRFIGERCQAYGSDVFETRLMMSKVFCVSGEDAARMFYVPDRFTRRGALPPNALTLPEAANAPQVAAQNSPQRPRAGVIADAIRNVQQYARRETFSNPEGGDQDVAPSIQFDTKGVEFGPWLRRFVAQIRRNWFIPYAAMSMHGRVVVTFFVHKDGRITDVQVIGPSPVDSFNRSAQNAILASTPTVALPPEYPDEKAFFTVTFYFNETPNGPSRPQAP